MKTVKVLVLMLVLGVAGVAYATTDEKAPVKKMSCSMSTEKGAACCSQPSKTKPDGGSCCVEGAACCKEGASCCAAGSSCCAEGAACCKEGASCCKEGSSCCAGECCKAGASCCAPASTSDAHTAGHSCCAMKKDSGKQGHHNK